MSDTPDAGALAPEDEARAHWYALISRLFHVAPDDALLQSLAAAPAGDNDDPDTPFLAAWREFQAACAAADCEAVRTEFDALFVGVGKAPVTPYTSAYAAAHAPDQHLLALREQLGACGLARRAEVFETEDHVSAICDAMRGLIEHGRPLKDQRAFFDEYVAPGVPPFCSAIKASPMAAFYLRAGALALAFYEVEKEAFDMHTEA
jgi:TorA maturation chaperone TorD